MVDKIRETLLDICQHLLLIKKSYYHFVTYLLPAGIQLFVESTIFASAHYTVILSWQLSLKCNYIHHLHSHWGSVCVLVPGQKYSSDHCIPLSSFHMTFAPTLTSWCIKKVIIVYESVNYFAFLEERLNVVEAFFENNEVRHLVYNDYLRRIPDLQRIAKKLHSKRASLQDCYRVYQAIGLLPQLLESLEMHSGKHTSKIMELFTNPLKVRSFI